MPARGAWLCCPAARRWTGREPLPRHPWARPSHAPSSKRGSTEPWSLAGLELLSLCSDAYRSTAGTCCGLLFPAPRHQAATPVETARHSTHLQVTLEEAATPQPSQHFLFLPQPRQPTEQPAPLSGFVQGSPRPAAGTSPRPSAPPTPRPPEASAAQLRPPLAGKPCLQRPRCSLGWATQKQGSE